MIYRHIEEKTSKILQEVGIETPSKIDITKIASHFLIDVQSADLENDISGLFVIKDKKAYIRYNKTESQHRVRFTIAHELGHYFLHKDTPLFVDRNESVLYRNNDSTTGEIIKEREANAFAAALLMPSHFIEKEMNGLPISTDIIPHLASVFNVSTQAMSFRLSNLGYDFGLF